MRIENIDTSPNIVARQKTGIFEDGFRNKLLRDSEGETFCGIQVYHLFIHGVQHSVLYFDDLVELLGLPDWDTTRFKTLFISTNFRKMFILRRGGVRKGYCRADEMKRYSIFYKQYLIQQHGAFTHDAQQLAGIDIKLLPSYVLNNFARVRMNFGQVNSSVRNFLERFIIPISKVLTDFMAAETNTKLSKMPAREYKFNEIGATPIVEPTEPVKKEQWVIACAYSDGLRFHGDRIWHSEADCRAEVARLVLTTGHPHVKLLIQERAEVSTSIVWS